MKKQIKKIAAAMLMLAVMLTCVPTTAYAKEPFKWETSLTLTGKQFMTRDGVGYCDFLIYFDRDTTVIEDFGAKEKYKVKYKAGLNTLSIIPRKGVKYKAGAEYKCKITAKDANMVLLGGYRVDASVGMDESWYISVKTLRKFDRWVAPQKMSLHNYLDGFYGQDFAKLLIDAGIAKKSERNKLAKKIDKYIGDVVQKSKMKGDKIISHVDALLLYVDSVDGLEEKLKNTVDKYHSKLYGEEVTYWETLLRYVMRGQDTVNGASTSSWYTY